MYEYFKFPREIANDCDYYKALSSTIESFAKRLKNIADSKEEMYSHLSRYQDRLEKVSTEVLRTKDKILSAYRESLKGNYTKAVRIIKNIINDNEDNLVMKIKESHAFLGRGCLEGNVANELILFRGRIDECLSLGFKDMSHIPLNEREKVKSCRFSLSGTPCLYLAQNSYVVWNELGRPNFESLSISAVKCELLEEKIIDLTFPYFFYTDLLSDSVVIDENNIDKILNYFKSYPFILACSFKCLQKNRNFKSEYVIPQLIMQTIGEKYIGVAYKSNMINPDCELMATNLAIPIVDYKWNSKYGRIMNKIEITEPINLGYYNNVIHDKCLSNVIDAKGKGKGKTKFERKLNGVGYWLSPFNKGLNNNLQGSYDDYVPYLDSIFSEFDDFIIFQNEFNKVC